ncbi:MAG: thioredoxin domain-containing protein [Nitrososphaerota archaeon]
MPRYSSRINLNRLADAKSPYLRSHADDPVDWYAWGEEAFKKAREEDKPILLSVGYSSCHWCHVMQRESFKNPAIADIINNNFVPVKVDREERPDVDSIYMRAVILMTGQGGWPLTVFLTPDLKPFFGGTYFPPEPRHGLPSFKQVLLAVRDAWARRREEVLNSGSTLFEMVAGSLSIGGGAEAEIDRDVMSAAYEQLVLLFDEEFGGLKGAPKFPMPVNYLFLLRYWRLSREGWALRMVEKTLKAMFLGGVYDHAGGGFHRYSVDKAWFIPHFEKMLYDNALLIKLYAEAWVASRNPLFKFVAKDTSNWLLSELASPRGGFYSSLDAESGGVEGGYYLYSWREVVDALGEETARMLGCTESGNLGDGLNLVRLPEELERISRHLGMSIEEALKHIKNRLLQAREKKERPAVDEKIIVSWNGLAISSLSYAGAVFSERSFVEAATQAADFILDNLYSGGVLRRYWLDAPSEAGGLLEDYALLGCGLLDLYQWTGAPRYLEAAASLAGDILEKFQSSEGGFYDAPPEHDTPIRPFTVEDHAYPSGYSATILLLSQLYLLTGETPYENAARKALKRIWGRIVDDPLGRLAAVSAVPYLLGSGAQLVVTAEGEFWREIGGFVSRFYEPYMVVSGGKSELVSGLWEGKSAVEGKPTYYLCKGFKCLLPTTSLDELEKMLSNTS